MWVCAGPTGRSVKRNESSPPAMLTPRRTLCLSFPAGNVGAGVASLRGFRKGAWSLTPAPLPLASLPLPTLSPTPTGLCPPTRGPGFEVLCLVANYIALQRPGTCTQQGRRPGQRHRALGDIADGHKLRGPDCRRCGPQTHPKFPAHDSRVKETPPPRLTLHFLVGLGVPSRDES